MNRVNRSELIAERAKSDVEKVELQGTGGVQYVLECLQAGKRGQSSPIVRWLQLFQEQRQSQCRIATCSVVGSLRHF